MLAFSPFGYIANQQFGCYQYDALFRSRPDPAEDEDARLTA